MLNDGDLSFRKDKKVGDKTCPLSENFLNVSFPTTYTMLSTAQLVTELLSASSMDDEIDTPSNWVRIPDAKKESRRVN